MKNDRRIAWIKVLLAGWLLGSGGCLAQDQKPPAAPRNRYLYSPLAGDWYPGEKKELSAQIRKFLQHAKTPPRDGIAALILPHAGYHYSGAVAAAGVKALAGKKFHRVVILGPSHHAALYNRVILPSYDEYGTPLRRVSIDRPAVAALKSSPYFLEQAEVERIEHSVQIQLPLLQQVLGEFLVLPLVVGQLDEAAAAGIAKALAAVIDPQTLVVVSSDFTHYGANYGYRPFADDIPANLKKLDLGAFEKIAAQDPAGLAAYLEKTGDTVCGSNPIRVLLHLLPAAARAELIRYDTSGAQSGDFSNSVSYLAIAFSAAWPKPAEKKEPAPAMEKNDTLPTADQQQLLKLARQTLANYLQKGKRSSPEELGIKISEPMKKVMGAFVTLKENGELRGCIGEIEPRRPLYQAVMDQAINAGVNDPRFRPVSSAELPRLHLEISALTPSRPVKSYEEIEVGKHGVLLEKGFSGAVFLPQVAPEQGWNREEMLTHLSLKAGLPPKAWREGASFKVFEAIVFAEPQP